MKKTKFLVAILLFFISFILIGEFYVWHLYTFPSEFPSTTLYLQEGQTQKELLRDVTSAAAETGVDVFVVDTEMNSAVSVTIHIYGSENVIQKLVRCKIETGSYKSLFLGTINIEIEKFDEMPSDFIPNRFFLTGSYTDNVAFKQLLINKYAGNFPKQIENTNQNIFMICGLWLVVFTLLLLISLYDLALIKREGIVRMVSGEPLSIFVLTNILRDSCVFSIIFFLLLFLTSIFTKPTFFFNITLAAFIIFIAINVLLNLKLLRVDFRKDVCSKQSAKGILKISYFYKCAAIILTIFVVNGNIQLIRQGATYFLQKDFFEQHKDYYYLNVSTNSENSPDSDTQILEKLLSDPRHLTLIDLQASNDGVEYIYTDSSSKDYLSEQIPSIENIKFESKVYLFIPKEFIDDSLVKENTLWVWSTYYRDSFDYEFIEYDNANIMAIKNTGTSIESTRIVNPIIIYNNLGAASYSAFFNLEYVAGSTLFNIPEDNLANIDLNGQINYATNANENYLFHIESERRNVITGVVFLGLIVLLNSVISKSMLYYEYKIRAVEYTLKKILGEHLLVSNMRVFLLSAISAGVATIISSIIMLVLGNQNVMFNIFGSIMVVFLDFCFSGYYIHIISRVSISRVFKGGSI